MQNNNSVEEERQEQCHVEENEFDMINYMHARPVHGASTQRSQWQPLYIGQLDLHKKCVISGHHSEGYNEEAVDGSSLFYTLNEAKGRGSGAILGNQHLMSAQADGSGHKEPGIGRCEAFQQELPVLQMMCYTHLARSSKK